MLCNILQRTESMNSNLKCHNKEAISNYDVYKLSHHTEDIYSKHQLEVLQGLQNLISYWKISNSHGDWRITRKQTTPSTCVYDVDSKRTEHTNMMLT